MVNPLTQILPMELCEDAHDAVRKGFLYREPIYKPIELKKVVVVKNGTEAKCSTVDFIVEDEKGQKYVFMITGNLLKSIPYFGD